MQIRAHLKLMAGITTVLTLASCNSSQTPAAGTQAIGTQRLLCDPASDPNCSTGGGGITGGGVTPLGGNDRSVEIYLNSLSAYQTTDDGSFNAGLGNTRDEVFMEVMADTPSGQYGLRLPRRDDQDDYYTFTNNQTSVATDVSNWLNRDSAYMGKPVIYSGSLKDGQSIRFVVTLLEQDNTTLGGIKSALTAALSVLTGPIGATKNPYAIAGLAGAQGLTALLPNVNANDVIGAFTVTVTNTGGVLTRTWIPFGPITTAKSSQNIATTTLVSGSPFAVVNTSATKDTQTFTMAATGGGSYSSTVSVETVDDAKAYDDRPLKFLGTQLNLWNTTLDACGSDNLVVDGRVRVGKNQTVGTNISLSGGNHWWNSGSYFHWTCDGTDEQTGAADSSMNYLIAAHYGGYGDRNIHWSTFTKVDR